MTNTKRWLDELPLESRERELLLVGKSARPAEGAVDANWLSICAALGTTATSSVVASSVASNSVSASAKVGASMVVSKAGSAGLVLAAAKSLALGVTVGLAVMGASSLAEHASKRHEPSPSPNKPTPVATAQRGSAHSLPVSPATPAVAQTAPSGLSAANVAPSAPPSRERIAGSANSAIPAADLAAMSPEAKSASLAQQARELAELKRLIDSGAPSEALRRLNDDFKAGATLLLSEERDALYVQALARAQRRQEARAAARQFLVRYPNSPYFETMRQLLTEK